MAVSNNTILEVQTGGSDSANSGGFDPTNPTFDNTLLSTGIDARNAVCTVGANNYSFVSGDVGHWLFIKSGTNWNPGWYKITSVGGTAATVDAAIGHGISYPSMTPTTVQGVGTVASPSSGSWSIDYSQATSSSVPYAWSGTITIGGTTTQLTTSGTAWGYNMVGNVIHLSGGGATTGFYVVNSYNGTTTITLNASAGSAGGSVSGYMGGPLASPGYAMSVTAYGGYTAMLFIQSGTYSVTTTSSNVAAGVVSGTGQMRVEGYGTYRGDLGTAPLIQASGLSGTFVMFTWANNQDPILRNLTVDCASLGTSTAFKLGRTATCFLTAKNATNSGFTSNSGSPAFYRCVATGCSGSGAGFNGVFCVLCEAYSNTVTGFSIGSGVGVVLCLSYSNTGSTSVHGFTDGGNTGAFCQGCVAYGNGGDGFNFVSHNYAIVNCLAEANGRYGFNFGNAADAVFANCGAYNNTTANTNLPTYMTLNTGYVNNVTGTFFTNPTGSPPNFTLNNLAGQGALARAAGVPGTFTNAAGTGYIDIGAFQHQDTGGGGGGGTQQAADEGGVLIIPGQAWW